MQLHHMTPTPMEMSSCDETGIIWQKCLVAPLFNCLNLRNTMVPLIMLVWCDSDAATSGIKWPKSHVASHFNCLDKRNEMVPLFCCLWDHMVPIGSHDQNSYVAPCFDHLDIINEVVLLTMPLASCNVTTGATGITWLKVRLHFNFNQLQLWNGVVPLTVP